MDPHRDRGDMMYSSHRQQQQYMRGDGPRAIPPSSMPSLSTGQGFYTVESLQGATVVPPPQPAPPPPRILPPADPYSMDSLPRRRHPVPHPDDSAFGMPRPPLPFDRGHPFLPPPGRRQLPPRPEFGGPGMMHPSPFMGDPRMPPFHPGRESFRGREQGWGPARGFDRHWPDRRMDPGFERQRGKRPGTKRVKPEAKSSFKSGNPGDQSTAGTGPGWCDVCQINCFNVESLEQHLAGKRHKRQLESQNQAENEGADEGKSSLGDDAANEVGIAEKVCQDGEVGLNEIEAAEKAVEVGVKASGNSEKAEEEGSKVEEDGSKLEEDGSKLEEGASKALEELVEDEVMAVEKAEEEIRKTDMEAEKVAEKNSDMLNAVAQNDSAEEASIKILKQGDEIERTDIPGGVKNSSPLAGRKRGTKDLTQATKKRQKGETQNAGIPGEQTEIKQGGSEGSKKDEKVGEVSEACDVCNATFSSKATLETHLKSKKHAARVKKVSNSPNVKEDGGGNLTETVDLANGKTGQSAEVQ